MKYDSQTSYSKFNHGSNAQILQRIWHNQNVGLRDLVIRDHPSWRVLWHFPTFISNSQRRPIYKIPPHTSKKQICFGESADKMKSIKLLIFFPPIPSSSPSLLPGGRSGRRGTHRSACLQWASGHPSGLTPSFTCISASTAQLLFDAHQLVVLGLWTKKHKKQRFEPCKNPIDGSRICFVALKKRWNPTGQVGNCGNWGSKR